MSSARRIARKRTRGERVCAFIEKHCIVPEGSLIGQHIKLADFQRKFILDVYDNPHGTQRAILSIARKNAKTALISCLVLAHLVGPEAITNSEIVSGARSREQAAKVFKYASKMRDLSPTLSKLVKVIPSGKKLIGLPRNVEYFASSAEAGTAHGGSPVLAILDEVGQVKGEQDDFIDAIITSQGAYDDPLQIIISTQARNDTDLLSIWIDAAMDGDDPHKVCHLYVAEDGCDLDDESAWDDANPAIDLFRSRKDIRGLSKDAVKMPSLENTFRNLYLNQRVTITAPFVSKSVWKSCGKAPTQPDPSLPVWAGLDLSKRTDLTALVLIQQLKGIWQVWPYFWAPEEGIAERSRRDRSPYERWAKEGFIFTTPGATVDYDIVAEDLRSIFEDFLVADTVQGLAFDAWRMDVLIASMLRVELSHFMGAREIVSPRNAIPLIPFIQGFRSMSPAIEATEELLLNRKYAHGNNPVLTMCAANAVVRLDPAANRKLDKSQGTGRIDGMVSLVMASGIVAAQSPKKPSVYTTRGALDFET